MYCINLIVGGYYCYFVMKCCSDVFAFSRWKQLHFCFSLRCMKINYILRNDFSSASNLEFFWISFNSASILSLLYYESKNTVLKCFRLMYFTFIYQEYHLCILYLSLSKWDHSKSLLIFAWNIPSIIPWVCLMGSMKIALYLWFVSPPICQSFCISQTCKYWRYSWTVFVHIFA